MQKSSGKPSTSGSDKFKLQGSREKLSQSQGRMPGDRRSYGNMLPKTGVYFLPDSKVIDFCRVLTDYKKQCEQEGKYVEARKAKKKHDELREKEMKR